MARKIEWLDEPERHDYTAALSYLSQRYSIERASELVHELREAEISHVKAKDIIRTSDDEPLPETNSHIEHNLEKIEDGKKLSPILLVTDVPNKRLFVADGWHRACAVNLHDEDTEIPCKHVWSAT